MKEKTLHVVCGSSAKGTLRLGLGKDNISDEITYPPIDFSFGYIPKDFSDNELCFALAYKKQYDLFDFNEQKSGFEELKRFITTDYMAYDKVIVWHGWSVYDLFTLYLMSKLVKENLYQVDIRESPTFLKKVGHKFPEMGEVSPDDIYYMLSLAKPLSKEEMKYCNEQWDRWANSNSRLRLSDARTGIVKEYPESFFDDSTIDAAQKHSNYLRIIGEVMRKYDNLSVNDMFLARRISHLIREGKLNVSISVISVH